MLILAWVIAITSVVTFLGWPFALLIHDFGWRRGIILACKLWAMVLGVVLVALAIVSSVHYLLLYYL